MAQKTTLSPMGIPGRTYTFSAKSAAVIADIVSFVLYVNRAAAFTLSTDRSRVFRLSIDQDRGITVER